MRAALADDESLDFGPASPTWPAGAPKDLQFVPIAPLMFGDGIEIGFTGSQRGPQVFQSPQQYFGNRTMKRPNLGIGQGCSHAARMNLGFPQGFVDIYVAQPGNKGLVEQQRF